MIETSRCALSRLVHLVMSFCRSKMQSSLWVLFVMVNSHGSTIKCQQGIPKNNSIFTCHHTHTYPRCLPHCSARVCVYVCVSPSTPNPNLPIATLCCNIFSERIPCYSLDIMRVVCKHVDGTACIHSPFSSGFLPFHVSNDTCVHQYSILELYCRCLLW